MKLPRAILAISIGFLFQPLLGIADPIANGGIPVDVCDLGHVKDKCRSVPLSVEDNMAVTKIPIGKVQFNRKYTLPAQPVHVVAGACEGHFAISYFQAGDQVKVDTEIKNDTCAASHGEFLLRIRTIDAVGESSTRSFSESWSRQEEGNVRVAKSYPMGGGQSLVWVRVNSQRKTACACD